MSRNAWALAESQHGVVTRDQLRDLGFDDAAIDRRIRSGRLHPIWRGAYAVGRRELSREGKWMAAVLLSGPGALLSHGTAAVLWRILEWHPGPVEVSIAGGGGRRRAGIVFHRRTLPGPTDRSERLGIPVTSPARTLVDLAVCVSATRLEAAVNEADKRDLIDPETLRAVIESKRGSRGVARLRQLLDRRTFTLTESERERRFLPLAREAGLPLPETGAMVDGFKVDFHWPELGLVVETDGLRYHRTPAQQSRDRLRDQAHVAAGLTTLRFTHAQVAHEPQHVVAILAEVADRLST